MCCSWLRNKDRHFPGRQTDRKASKQAGSIRLFLLTSCDLDVRSRILYLCVVNISTYIHCLSTQTRHTVGTNSRNNIGLSSCIARIAYCLFALLFSYRVKYLLRLPVAWHGLAQAFHFSDFYERLQLAEKFVTPQTASLQPPPSLLLLACVLYGLSPLQSVAFSTVQDLLYSARGREMIVVSTAMKIDIFLLPEKR